LLDFGMPIVEKDGKEFNFDNYKTLNPSELVEKGVLPNIEGLHDSSKNLIDAVIISHPHQDHYGLANFINGYFVKSRKACHREERSPELSGKRPLENCNLWPTTRALRSQ